MSAHAKKKERLPFNVKEWTPDNVATWLRLINCNHLVDRFTKAAVDGNYLLFDMDQKTLVNDFYMTPHEAEIVISEIARLKELYSSELRKKQARQQAKTQQATTNPKRIKVPITFGVSQGQRKKMEFRVPYEATVGHLKKSIAKTHKMDVARVNIIAGGKRIESDKIFIRSIRTQNIIVIMSSEGKKDRRNREEEQMERQITELANSPKQTDPPPLVIPQGKKKVPYHRRRFSIPAVSFPRAVKFKVIGESGVKVRQGVQISSPFICQLDTGTLVDAVEKQERRLRIISPQSGWISEYAADGYKICAPIDEKENSLLKKIDPLADVMSPHGARPKAKPKLEDLDAQWNSSASTAPAGQPGPAGQRKMSSNELDFENFLSAKNARQGDREERNQQGDERNLGGRAPKDMPQSKDMPKATPQSPGQYADQAARDKRNGHFNAQEAMPPRLSGGPQSNIRKSVQHQRGGRPSDHHDGAARREQTGPKNERQLSNSSQVMESTTPTKPEAGGPPDQDRVDSEDDTDASVSDLSDGGGARERPDRVKKPDAMEKKEQEAEDRWNLIKESAAMEARRDKNTELLGVQQQPNLLRQNSAPDVLQGGTPRRRLKRHGSQGSNFIQRRRGSVHGLVTGAGAASTVKLGQKRGRSRRTQSMIDLVGQSRIRNNLAQRTQDNLSSPLLESNVALLDNEHQRLSEVAIKIDAEKSRVKSQREQLREAHNKIVMAKIQLKMEEKKLNKASGRRQQEFEKALQKFEKSRVQLEKEKSKVNRQIRRLSFSIERAKIAGLDMSGLKTDVENLDLQLLTEVLIEQKKELDKKQRSLERDQTAIVRQEEVLKAKADSPELQHVMNVAREFVKLEHLAAERLKLEQELEQSYDALERSRVKLKKFETDKMLLRKGQKDLSKAQRELRMKTRQVDEREKRLKQHEHDLLMATEEIAQADDLLKREHKQLKQMRKNYTKKREDLRKDVDRLTVDKRRVEDMRRRIAQQEIQIHNDSTELETTREQVERQTKELDETRDAIAVQEHNIKRQQKKLHTQDRNLREDMERVNQEKDQILAATRKVQESTSALKDDRKKFEEEKQALQEQTDQLLDQRMSILNEKSYLEKIKNGEAYEDIQEKEMQLKLNKEKVEKQEKRFEQRKKAWEMRAAEIAAQEEKIRKSQKKVDEATRNFEKVSKELEGQREKLESEEAKLQTSLKDVEKVQHKLESRELLQEKQKIAMEQERQELELERRTLQNTNVQLEKARSRLNEDRKKAQDEQKKLQDLQLTMEAEMDAHRAKLKNADGDVARSQALQDMLSSSRGDSDEMDRKMFSQMSADIQERRKKLLARATDLLNQEREFEAKKAKTDKMAKEFQERDARLKDLESDLKSERAELEALRSKVEADQANVLSMKVKVDGEREELEGVRELLDERREELQKEAVEEGDAKDVLETERNILRVEQQALDEQKKALTEQRQKIEDQRQTFAQERAAFENQLNAYEKDSKSLSEDKEKLVKLKEQLEEREQKTSETQAELENLKQDIDGQQRAVKQDREMLQKEYEGLKDAKKDLAKAQKERRRAEENIKDVDVEKQALLVLMDNQAADFKKLQEKQDELEKVQRDVELQSDEHKVKTSMDKQWLQAEKDALNESKLEFHRLQKDIEKRQTELDRQQKEIRQQEANMTKIQDETRSERLKLDQDMGELDDQKADLERADTELNARTRKLENQERELEEEREAMAELREAEQRLEEDRRTFDLQSKEFTTKKEDLEKRRAALEEKETAVSEQQAEIQKSTEETEAKQRELKDLEASLRSRAEKLEEQSDDVQFEQERLSKDQKRVEDQQKELEQQQKKMTESQEQTKKERAELNVSRKELQQSQKDIELRENALEREKASLEDQRMDLDSTRSQVEEAQKQILQMKEIEKSTGGNVGDDMLEATTAFHEELYKMVAQFAGADDQNEYEDELHDFLRKPDSLGDSSRGRGKIDVVRPAEIRNLIKHKAGNDKKGRAEVWLHALDLSRKLMERLTTQVTAILTENESLHDKQINIAKQRDDLRAMNNRLRSEKANKLVSSSFNKLLGGQGMGLAFAGVQGKNKHRRDSSHLLLDTKLDDSMINDFVVDDAAAAELPEINTLNPDEVSMDEVLRSVFTNRQRLKAEELSLADNLVGIESDASALYGGGGLDTPDEYNFNSDVPSARKFESDVASSVISGLEEAIQEPREHAITGIGMSSFGGRRSSQEADSHSRREVRADPVPFRESPRGTTKRSFRESSRAERESPRSYRESPRARGSGRGSPTKPHPESREVSPDEPKNKFDGFEDEGDLLEC